MIDRKKVEEATHSLLLALGQDPESSELQETPLRVAKMYEELLSGYDYKVPHKFFELAGPQNLTALNNISFVSICEHHLLPFWGKAHIVYQSPQGLVPGLSKLARVVDKFSKRLQLQERLTDDIAQYIHKIFGCSAVLVKIEAEHGCISYRGTSKNEVKTLTLKSLGNFNQDPVLYNQALLLL